MSPSPAIFIYNLLVSTPLHASRGNLGGELNTNYYYEIISVFKIKSKRNFWGKWGNFFARGNFHWEGGGTLPKNHYKPSQDLCEATL